MGCPVQTIRQPGSRVGVLRRSRLRRHRCRCAQVQGCSTSVKHPGWEHAETVIPEGLTPSSILRRASTTSLWFIQMGLLPSRQIRPNHRQDSRNQTSGVRDRGCQLSRLETDRCLVYITSWTLPLTIYDSMHRRTPLRRAFSTRTCRIQASKTWSPKKLKCRGMRHNDSALHHLQEGTPVGRVKQLHPRRLWRLREQLHPLLRHFQ